MSTLPVGSRIASGRWSRPVDPRVKILYLIWVFLLISIVAHPVLECLIFLVTVAVVYASRLSLWALLKTGRLGVFMAVASWILWIIFLRRQGQVLFSVGRWHFTEPGIYNGLSVAARIAAILLAFLVVFKTTSNREIMTALYRLRLSVPFAMVVGITLRLIPQLQAEHAIIQEAQRARGVDFDKDGPLARLRKQVSCIIPLALRALKITSDLSLAMEARAFDPYARRTFSQALDYDTTDIVLLTVMAITIVASVVARVLGYGGLPENWIAKSVH
jgi:energy-coupling factor transport system permease protein